MIPKKVRRKLYEYVVDELGLQIIRGDYAPGDTLPNEDALCREFDVSRGVLREATKVLIQKGLIASRPKTGTQVLTADNWNLFDPDVLLWKYQVGNRYQFLKNVIEVRRIIEAQAARLAAERAGAETLRPIQKLYDQMAAVINEGSGYIHREYIRIDMEFHTAILEACGNELIAQIGHTMRQAFFTARKNDRQDIAAQRASMPPHREILNAIIARDPDRAQKAAAKHIDKVWRDISGKLTAD